MNTKKEIENQSSEPQKFDEQTFFNRLVQAVKAWQAEGARIDAHVRQMRDEHYAKYHDPFRSGL